ncbi:MAG: glycosyltransferase [Chloroflexi bacterium]|nr:glycosyltransferase [Chloroflexota bacterium]
MKSITISVVTCTFNSEMFLEKALKSIESQSYLNIEHVINDSYSTDSTLKIINEYIERNKNRYVIKFFQSEPKGVGNALNVATEVATGDVIHYLHSDDYYLDRDSLSKVVDYFHKNPDVTWLTGNFLVEFSARKFVIPQTYLLRDNPETALSAMNIISHENTFMKREFVSQYGGFNEGKNEVVEYSLWLRLIRDHKPLVVDDEFTVFIIHKGSTSTGSFLKFSKAILRAFHTQSKEKVFPLIGYYPDNQTYIDAKAFLDEVTRFIES